MPQLQLNIGYRPIRIGWCIRNGDIEAFRRAVRLTHTLWGGRYNPIICVDHKEVSRHLIELFKVDALFPVTSDEQISSFIKEFPYLPWPTDWKDLFIDSEHFSTLLDLEHPLRHLSEIHNFGKNHPGHTPPIYLNWSPSDPLKDIFACTYGDLPSREEIGRDYLNLYNELLHPESRDLTTLNEVPSDVYLSEHLSTICSLELSRDTHGNINQWQEPGLFLGDSSKFEDLLYFWNLRATNADLLFFDSTYSDRLFNSCRNWIEHISQTSRGRSGVSFVPHIWLTEEVIAKIKNNPEPLLDGLTISWSPINERVWLKKQVEPARMIFEESKVLASSDENDNHQLLVQLPESPFFKESKFHSQFAAITIRFPTDIARTSDLTFKVPYLPELNEYAGRNFFSYYWSKCRIQPYGIDLIERISQESIYLKPFNKRELISKTLAVFGIEANPSKPGLIAERLIKQMGGIQGCRIFKISGVRELIHERNPRQSFNRTFATGLIGRKRSSNTQAQLWRVRRPHDWARTQEAYSRLCF